MLRARPYLLLFFAALLVKGGVLLALHDHPLLQPVGEMDGAVYLSYARSGPPPVAYFLSPLYLYFLRLAGASIPIALVLQIVLGSLGVVLLYDTARRWFGSRGATITALLVLGTGVVTFNEVTILQSALDPFLVALMLWLLTRALQDGDGAPRRFAAAGAAAALFALNRPNALLWIAGLAALLLLQRRFRPLFAFGAGCLLMLAPVLVRNVVVARELVLVSSHGGLNFYIGNNETADGTYHAVRGIRPTIEGQSVDAQRVAEEAVGHPLAAREVSRWFYARAFAWMRAHPGDALRLFLRKLAYTIHQTDLSLNFSYDYFAHDVSSPLRILVVGPWLLVPLGFAGAATRRRDRPFLTLFAFVPLYALSVALFFVASRYRLPLLLMLAVAAAGIVEVRRVTQLIPALLLASVALWPFGLDSGRSDEQTNMVVRLIEQRQFTEAQELIGRLEPTHRDPARLHHSAALRFAAAGELARATPLYEQVLRDPVAQPVLRSNAMDELARLYVRQSRPDDVRRIFALEDRDAMSAERALILGRLALEIEDGRDAVDFLTVAVTRASSNGQAWHSLGVAHLALRENVPALAALTRAQSLLPNDAPTAFFLAVAQAENGNLAEARRSAEEALRLQPDFAPAKQLLGKLGGG
jgi:4-amino-4-deoxy-L-arabinose transferase-like glycosyltransferase